MNKEKMTPDPVTAGEVVEHLRAQVNDLAAQLDHARMANRGWREQMQEVQVTLSRTQQAHGQSERERQRLRAVLELIAESENQGTPEERDMQPVREQHDMWILAKDALGVEE